MGRGDESCAGNELVASLCSPPVPPGCQRQPPQNEGALVILITTGLPGMTFALGEALARAFASVMTDAEVTETAGRWRISCG